MSHVSPKMSRPSSVIAPACFVPGSVSCMRLIERRNVDFPQPDGPMSAVIDRDGTTRSMSNSTCFSPYQKEYLAASISPRIARPESEMRTGAGALISLAPLGTSSCPSSTKSPRYISLCSRILRRGEQSACRPDLDQLAGQHERRSVRRAGRLLHVVRHDH